MKRKINVQRDIESRQNISQATPVISKEKKAEPIITKNEEEKTQKKPSSETIDDVPAPDNDKKSGRKATGNI